MALAAKIQYQLASCRALKVAVITSVSRRCQSTNSNLTPRKNKPKHLFHPAYLKDDVDPNVYTLVYRNRISSFLEGFFPPTMSILCLVTLGGAVYAFYPYRNVEMSTLTDFSFTNPAFAPMGSLMMTIYISVLLTKLYNSQALRIYLKLKADEADEPGKEDYIFVFPKHLGQKIDKVYCSSEECEPIDSKINYNLRVKGKKIRVEPQHFARVEEYNRLMKF